MRNNFNHIDIFRSKKSAIESAKNDLRLFFEVKRLAYSNVKTTSCSCDCGETLAVCVTGQSKGKYEYVTKGICENCYSFE